MADPFLIAGGISLASSIFSLFNDDDANDAAQEAARRNEELLRRQEEANQRIGAFNTDVTGRNEAVQLDVLHDQSRMAYNDKLVMFSGRGLNITQETYENIDNDIIGNYVKAFEEIQFNSAVQRKNIKAQTEGASIAIQAQLNQNAYQAKKARAETTHNMLNTVFQMGKVGMQMYNMSQGKSSDAKGLFGTGTFIY